MKHLLLIAVLLATLAGCQCQTPEERQAAVAVRNQTMVEGMLPTAHKNLKSLGNEWYTFELEIDGTNRKFLFHWWYGSHSEIGRTVTELK